MSVTINGSAGVTTNSGAVYNGLQTGTAVSASGTSVTFTSIPSWVKRITVMFSGVSTNGSSVYLIQLGAGSVTTSGYLGSSGGAANGGASSVASSTAGMPIFNDTGTANILHGIMLINNITGNTWVSGHNIARSNQAVYISGGSSIALGGTLGRVRITTVNGTDTFDAGTINIIYE